MFEIFQARDQTERVFNLHHGDCLDGMRAMEDETVDLVVTSPPYNLGIAYGKYDDTGSRSAFIAWCQDWATEVKRVLKNEGSFFLNIGAAPSNPLLPHQLILALTGSGPEFILQNTFHWVKSITIKTRQGEEISAGHFKPIRSERYVNDCHEYLFHLTKTGSTPLERREAGVAYADKSNIGRWGHTAGKDKRCRGNTWFIPYETIQSRNKERPHPATFPVALVEQCIRLHGVDQTKHLMDPFLGIGTSAVAAKRMAIENFTGFEIDQDYLSVARERMEDESNTLFP